MPSRVAPWGTHVARAIRRRISVSATARTPRAPRIISISVNHSLRAAPRRRIAPASLLCSRARTRTLPATAPLRRVLSSWSWPAIAEARALRCAGAMPSGTWMAPHWDVAEVKERSESIRSLCAVYPLVGRSAPLRSRLSAKTSHTRRRPTRRKALWGSGKTGRKGPSSRTLE